VGNDTYGHNGRIYIKRTYNNKIGHDDLHHTSKLKSTCEFILTLYIAAKKIDGNRKQYSIDYIQTSSTRKPWLQHVLTTTPIADPSYLQTITCH